MGFSRGILKATEGELQGEEIEFMFNPTEYSVSKSNQWTATANKGKNVPKWEFKGGDPRTLTLELFFDSCMPRAGVAPGDVRKVTNQLFNLMMVDKGGQTKGPNSQMSHPPKCHLEWGKDTKNHFDGYITSCNVKYTLFNAEGTPVRATASLTLKEARDSEDRLPTNPTSIGEPGLRLWTVREGDRLDWLAYKEYGDAQQWRRIADANHLADPLDLQPGMVLAIPPRQD